MHPDRLRSDRERYDYPPAKLVKSNDQNSIAWKELRLWPDVPPRDWHFDLAQRRNYSSLQLDNFHGQLLASNSETDLKHGLLSIVFWGNVTAGYALTRVEQIIKGKGKGHPQNPSEILDHLVSARTLLNNFRIGEALIEILAIDLIGFSFASKLIAFMNPHIAVVYDDKISKHLASRTSPLLREMGGGTDRKDKSQKNKSSQAVLYEKWCDWCRTKAQELNDANSTWQDWDGLEHPWRAIDVERAYFSSAMHTIS